MYICRRAAAREERRGDDLACPSLTLRAVTGPEARLGPWSNAKRVAEAYAANGSAEIHYFADREIRWRFIGPVPGHEAKLATDRNARPNFG